MRELTLESLRDQAEAYIALRNRRGIGIDSWMDTKGFVLADRKALVNLVNELSREANAKSRHSGPIAGYLPDVWDRVS